MITTINNDQAITKGMFNSVEHFFDFMDKTFTFANNNISEQTIFYNKFHEACSNDIIDKDLKRLVYNRTITTGEIIHITRSGRLIIANLFADEEVYDITNLLIRELVNQEYLEEDVLDDIEGFLIEVEDREKEVKRLENTINECLWGFKGGIEIKKTIVF